MSDDASIVPIVVPDLDEVRAFAAKLHAEGKAWNGEAFGWQAEYNPERPESPLDSKMTFMPADSCIRERGIWFFSLCGSMVAMQNQSSFWMTEASWKRPERYRETKGVARRDLDGLLSLRMITPSQRPHARRYRSSM